MIKLQKLKSLYFKVKNKLSDGSIDSYHYQIIFYCMFPFALLLFLALEVFIFNNILNNFHSTILTVFELFSGVIFFIINIYLLFFFTRKIVSFFKHKYILLLLSILPTSLFLLIATLFWFSVVLVGIQKIFTLTFNFNMPVLSPYVFLKLVANFSTIIAPITILFLLPIAISLSLNSLLPRPLQKKDISTKQKLTRMSIKLSFILIAIFISYIFSIISIETFASISMLTTLFTFICTPKTILRIFSTQKNIEGKKITDDVLTKFEMIKFVYYEFVFAWSISIYIFNPEKTEDRIKIFFISFFILIITSAAIQWYLKKEKSDFFSKWIVDNEDDEIEKSNGENIKSNKEVSEMIEAIKQYLNKEIFIDGCYAKIIDALICSDGDFFDVKFTSGDKNGTKKRYSASDANFIKSLPDLNKPPQS